MTVRVTSLTTTSEMMFRSDYCQGDELNNDSGRRCLDEMTVRVTACAAIDSSATSVWSWPRHATRPCPATTSPPGSPALSPLTAGWMMTPGVASLGPRTSWVRPVSHLILLPAWIHRHVYLSLFLSLSLLAANKCITEKNYGGLLL